jgi:two-component system nitrogen regulation response regulator GlnG
LPPELTANPKSSAPFTPTVKSPSPVGLDAPYVSPTASDGEHWSQLVYADTLARLQAGENNVIDALYEQLETVCIQAALHHTQGHKSEAALRLGLGRNTLARKAKK